MTESEQIVHIKKTKKFPMTFDDYTNWFMFSFPIALICLGLLPIYDFIYSERELIKLLLSILMILLGVAFTFITYKRLMSVIIFESIDAGSSNDIDAIATKLRLNFKLKDITIDKNLGLVKAYTKMTAFSWGEKITIIIDGNHILINSRPTGLTQPVTIYKDIQNIKKLKEILK